MIWKPIKDWEWYLVDEYGNVKNTRTNKLIIGDKNNMGYRRVCLYNGNNHQRFFRHRLVAEYFIPNPDNFPEVNHIDGNKDNCYYKNLEWCNRSDNELHAWKTELKHYNSGIIKNKPFIVEFDSGETKTYKNQYILARELNLSQATIGGWLTGRTHSYYKYNVKSIKFINV